MSLQPVNVEPTTMQASLDQQSVASVQGAARWIVAAFAAIGAILVGGLQVGSLGELETEEPFRLIVALTKAKAGCWTRWRAFAQVRQGSNIQLLPFPLVAAWLLH
jgi:hypothetical protein